MQRLNAVQSSKLPNFKRFYSRSGIGPVDLKIYGRSGIGLVNLIVSEFDP